MARPRPPAAVAVAQATLCREDIALMTARLPEGSELSLRGMQADGYTARGDGLKAARSTQSLRTSGLNLELQLPEKPSCNREQGQRETSFVPCTPSETRLTFDLS
jgi:hypothetical protein